MQRVAVGGAERLGEQPFARLRVGMEDRNPPLVELDPRARGWASRSFAATGGVLWRFADVVMCCVLCPRGRIAREIDRSACAPAGFSRCR